MDRKEKQASNTFMELYQRIEYAEMLMKEFESKSMYLEAEHQRQVIQALRRDLAVPLKEEEFLQGWADALQNTIISNQQRWKDFELVWSSKLKEHDVKTNALLECIHQKHRNRLHDLAQMSEKGIRYPKWSNKLLELRKRQYLLGKTQRYIEAEQIKIQADALESRERSTILEAIEKDIKTKNVRLEKQFQRELEICKDKMSLEKQCILEGRQRMAMTLRHQCEKAVEQIKNRAQQAAGRRQTLLERIGNNDKSSRSNETKLVAFVHKMQTIKELTSSTAGK